jgi:hypothetical protein
MAGFVFFVGWTQFKFACRLADFAPSLLSSPRMSSIHSFRLLLTPGTDQTPLLLDCSQLLARPSDFPSRLGLGVSCCKSRLDRLRVSLGPISLPVILLFVFHRITIPDTLLNVTILGAFKTLFGYVDILPRLHYLTLSSSNLNQSALRPF